MNCRYVTDTDGNEYLLSEDEEKYVRAIERLERMNPGRLSLFGNGYLSLRINGSWYNNDIISFDIKCDGGDGGDKSQ